MQVATAIISVVLFLAGLTLVIRANIVAGRILNEVNSAESRGAKMSPWFLQFRWPMLLARHRELLVVRGVHEVEVVAVAIQELDLAVLEIGARPFLTRLEGTLHGLTALDIAQLDAHLGRTLVIC